MHRKGRSPVTASEACIGRPTTSRWPGGWPRHCRQPHRVLVLGDELPGGIFPSLIGPSSSRTVTWGFPVPPNSTSTGWQERWRLTAHGELRRGVAPGGPGLQERQPQGRIPQGGNASPRTGSDQGICPARWHEAGVIYAFQAGAGRIRTLCDRKVSGHDAVPVPR